MLKGFDGSHYQKVNDWNTVKNDGISFVFWKATEGNNYVDPTFASSVSGARAVGLEVGAYHFARFANTIDAKMEADFFLQTIKGADLTLPVVLDIETNDNKLGHDLLTECVKAFCDEVEATGQKVIIYTYKGFMPNFDIPTNTLFWFARYGVSQPDVHSDFWQFTDKGTVAGVEGNVDMDYFMGDVLPTINGAVSAVHIDNPVPTSESAPVQPAPKPVPQPAPAPQAHGTYVVQRGDTFYGIAGKLKINVSDLIKLNPNVRPRAMQIGAVLKLPVASQPQVQSSATYVVKSGDSLSKIAVAHGVSLTDLEKANPQIGNPNEIQIGQIIHIPAGHVSTPAPQGDQKTVSLVDYLVSIHVDSSMTHRTKLAHQYGITNYSGTAEQNSLLLKKIRGH